MREALLKGRVALVTGASRRIGIDFATAHRLALLGADLFLHSFSLYDAAQTWGADSDGLCGFMGLGWRRCVIELV